MNAEPNEILTIEECDETFETWANKAFISPETRSSILKSNFLIVPTFGFRDVKMPVFPVCTEELFQFIKEKASPETVPEICIEEKEYKELALHSALLIVGAFVVTALMAPIAADLISEYIKQRVFRQRENYVENAKRKILNEPIEKNDVRVELTVVEQDGRSLKFNYEGPADEFRKTINAALKAPVKKRNPAQVEVKEQAKLPPTK